MNATENKKLVKNRETGSIWEVNELNSQVDVENHCPLFFSCKHGRRETYTFYRGQIIVRNTVQFTGVPPERRTVVYLFVKEPEHSSYDTMCVGHPSSIYQAKKLIDEILESGEY